MPCALWMCNKEEPEMNIIQRVKSPTPPFFKKLRTAGLVLAAVGGVLVAAPVALPAAIVAAGGYLIVAGSVATAISQTVVQKKKK